MGYADGYYYGQGRIICDTSTFSVGDTIRVRSMTDSNKVWNKTVATVGTALVFTVPCYDYYKICTVQTINDTPTEIGGEYRTLDYGQTIFIDTLNLNSLAGHQALLNAHQHTNKLAIGDEIDIKIGGVDTTFQIAGFDINDSNEIIYVAKNVYGQSPFNQAVTNASYNGSTLRATFQTIYSQIDANDRAYLKDMTKDCYSKTGAFISYTDKVCPLTFFEVFGIYPNTQTPLVQQHQLPLFITASNRIKELNGSAWGYWTSDFSYNQNYCYGVNDTGSYTAWTENNNTVGVVPCFHLTADS